MKAYAVGHFETVDFNAEIVEYLQRIVGTLEPFEGRFLIHGGDLQVLEHEWRGNLVVIEFPDLAAARAWYESPAYQEILPLRTKNSQGRVALATGVGEGYSARNKVDQLTAG